MFNIPKGILSPIKRLPKVILPYEPTVPGMIGISDSVHNYVIDTCDAPEELETLKIANEYEKFTVDTTKLVRYGAADQWVTKVVSGTGEATNHFFGSDPAPGVAKVVEVFLRKPAPPPPPCCCCLMKTLSVSLPTTCSISSSVEYTALRNSFW